ncbi:glucose 1-dehydrogenase [Halomarina litorea]|uniref:glucose 1-dehydrogenase n=1 Tax=Halomarina litorea TaxID=2961595 RepID=UPI0020C586FE|nr:glucose 1-dehydrogenase [Halomarina sp. BCD28]
MQALVARGDGTPPELVERPRPEPAAGEALVRVLRVGIDGTDHEVVAGNHGSLPEGADAIVLGHEAVGVVEDPNGTDLREGQVVAPTVRRPPAGGTNEFFERGEPDMAPEGMYVERGIDGADGFMADYVTSPAEYLVPVPRHLAEWGLLVEPLSVSEKALEHAFASRSAFEWTPERTLVLGNGSLGLLTLAMLVGRDDVERAYCLGRRDRPDPTIDFIERLGATYVDSRTTPVPDIPDRYEPMDLVYEATGYARHAVETVSALAPGGVGALVGVPEPWTFEVDGGQFHRDLVLGNRALVGTVNSGRGHFETAVETLQGLPEWVPEAVLTDVVAPEEAGGAFADGDERTIKTAVEFSTI